MIAKGFVDQRREYNALYELDLRNLSSTHHFPFGGAWCQMSDNRIYLTNLNLLSMSPAYLFGAKSVNLVSCDRIDTRPQAPVQ